MSSREIIFVVDDQWAGSRIDKALGSVKEIGSRSKAEWLIEQSRVFLNGKPVKSSYKVKLNDNFLIQLPEVSDSEELRPREMPLDILFEDGDLIVLNKPAGLVMHPAAGHADDTLVNALLAHTKDLSFRFGEKRPGIVHRLDRDTSGVLVIAKNDSSHEILSSQFRNRTIHRIYRALVIGSIRSEKGSFTSYLARHPTHRKKFASVKGEFSEKNPPPLGKWARTHFQVLSHVSQQIHYLQLKLDTGRTHQIRVHLSEAGAPIAGDILYGAGKKTPALANMDHREIIRMLPRFALHACELGFLHPVTKKEMFFKVSWPNDMKPSLEKLGLKDV